jgi:predicted nucleic acid-binding protein
MTRLILDAGAFVAFERGDVRVRARLHAARRLELDLLTSSPIVAQVWRDGRKQAEIARLLSAVAVDAPNEADARRAGALLGKTRTIDVVDALLIGLARDGDSILTSDPKDITTLLRAMGRRAVVITV